MLDPAALLDAELRVIHGNRAYWRLLGVRPPAEPSRFQAVCHTVLALSQCDEQCIAQLALLRERPQRFGEVHARKLDLRLEVTALPMHRPDAAVLEIYRDTTAESKMQENYRVLLDKERARAEDLQEQVHARTIELEKKNAELTGLNDELLHTNQALSAAHLNSDRIFAALTSKLVGTLLDHRFKIEEQIGEGGFGAVYRAIDQTTGDVRAAKVFRPKPGNDTIDGLKRFVLEAVSASRINHPNVVKTFHSNVTDEGIAYVIMEYLEGYTLGQEMESSGRISIERSIAVTRAVCEVMIAAEQHGLMHRDIKPENVFIHLPKSAGEIVKVIDFGNSKSAATPSLTQSMSISGTPIYLAPERFEGVEYDSRSDVYSVAIMLFQMLTARLPFDADPSDLWSVLRSRLEDTAHPVRSFVPEASADLEALIAASLSRNPANRPTPSELARRLKELGQSDSVAARSPNEPHVPPTE